MISEKHVRSLAERGITNLAAEQAGIRSVSHLEACELLNRQSNDADKDFSGIWIPYFHPKQQTFTPFGRLRLDTPYSSEKGTTKYLQRKLAEGEDMKLYFPPLFSVYDRERWSLALAESHRPLPLFIVEGEFKALSLQSRLVDDAIIIGVGGVDMWSRKQTGFSRNRLLLPSFDFVDFQGREVYICYDSDTLTNKHVARAERQLASALRRQKRPKEVRLVTVPTGPSGEKLGLDDWLAEQDLDWEENFFRLVEEAQYKRVAVPEPIDVLTFNRKVVPKSSIYCGNSSVAFVVGGSVSFLHASSGVGKSYLGIQLAASIASGVDYLGCSLLACPFPKKVLYIQAEMPDAWWQPRTQMLERSFGGALNSNLILINDRFTLADNDKWSNFLPHYEVIETLIKQHRPDVVFMDPLSGFYDLTESNTDLNRKFMARLTQMAIFHNIGLVFIHHDRKDQAGNTMHTMRGSSAFSDWATSVFGVRPALDEEEDFSTGRRKVVKVPSPTDLEILFEKTRLANGPKPNSIRVTRMPGSSFFTIVEEDGEAPF